MTKDEIKILGEIFFRISQKTYEELGAEYKLEKEKKLQLDKKFSSDLSIEERAKLDNKYIDDKSKKEILNVISCLQDPKYSFTKNDIDKLTTFTSKLNFILSGTSPRGKGMADRMNNIKHGLIKEGKLLELDVLFNEFKKANSWKLFKDNTSINSAFFNNDEEWKFIYLFSNCKNCQDKINYPLYYSAWQIIAYWCFKVEKGDYDAFCEYYRKLDFLGVEKQLNFSCYYELLRLRLRDDLEFTKWLGTLDENKRKKILKELRITEGLSIDEIDLDIQTMDKKEQFKEWLKTNYSTSSTKAFSGINKVSEICLKSNMKDIFSLEKDDLAALENELRKNNEFIQANESSNGWLSAAIGQYKKFLGNKKSGPSTPPNVPFNEFCWFWATTGVSEWLNDPLYLFIVCKAIEENGNGNPTYTGTNTFKDIVKRIAISNNVDLATADQLARTSNPPDKNILENSNSYWLNLDLVLTSPNPATLSIGAINSLSNFNSFKELLRERIRNYKLPNFAILNSGRNSAEIETRKKGWSNNKEFVFPFWIIAKIFKALELEDSSQRYLTNDDLCRIIIPLSAVKTDISTYIENILRFRNNPSDYALWPKPQESVNNGDRMANEYLLFLEMMGLLSSNKPGGSYKAVDKKYKLETSDSLDFILSENNSNQTPPEATEDNDCKSERKADYKENKIFFGAPGTGKSYEISQLLKQRIPNKKCREKFVFRVTFHPEYDHASFVGGYKPYSKDSGGVDYKFVPQIFTNLFVKAVNDPDNQYYLVIEEINRGNCAEIFGDIFQLLDRNKEYSINPSKELADYLNGKDEKGDNIIQRPSDYWENGKKMLLPDNITIWATMNTSDQSLMPMDSAFKRRWEWQYIPINYGEYIDEQKTKKNESFNYMVRIGDSESFSWIRFIETVNHKISKIESLGMDKCLGNYFIQMKEGETIIPQDIFVNKVLFYLWNDVFKDENDDEGGSIFKRVTFMDFFPKEKARDNLEKILTELNEYRAVEKMIGQIYDNKTSTELNTSETKSELNINTEEKGPE